jgi:hypothetical protein
MAAYQSDLNLSVVGARSGQVYFKDDCGAGGGT